jgi:hypothetical protein
LKKLPNTFKIQQVLQKSATNLGMKRFITFTLVLIINQATFSSTVFRCQVPVTPFDTGFQQGQELYMDVSYKQGKPEVKLYRLAGDKLLVHENQEIYKYGFSDDFSTFYTSWVNTKSYLSMVYLGGKRWGAYLKLQPNPSSFPNESEFMCNEAKDITSL